MVYRTQDCCKAILEKTLIDVPTQISAFEMNAITRACYSSHLGREDVNSIPQFYVDKVEYDDELKHLVS